MSANHDTHTVFNQPRPLIDCNLFELDATLARAVSAFDGGWGESILSAYGALTGGELGRLGHLANRHPPELRTHDAYGHRIDEVEFHPSYHGLLGAAIAHGVHSLAWESPRPGGHVVRAALEFLHNQADSGTDCPLTMTYAGVAAIRAEPAVAAIWQPKILSRTYDRVLAPQAQKRGVTIGMAMTEKQGGTDVRANTSTAAPQNEQLDGGEGFRLTGHKWFCSAPMSDAFLTLAQLQGELTCFLMPRVLPDGTRNGIRLQRLKDKLGNRSNASSEIEFRDALAVRIGEPGRGVQTIIQMVALTRFNCMVGSAAIMRHAVLQAVSHVRQREVGGVRLIDAPLMRNVVADLILESEAALWMVMRVARAIDAGDDPVESAFLRIATALGKYWICKRAPQQVNEAAECLGGLGYVEDSIMPRLYREAPVNSIWEGSGNVQCLDLLRAISRQPTTVDVYLGELDKSRGSNRTFDRLTDELANELRGEAPGVYSARALIERMAVMLQAGMLLRHAEMEVADAFIVARLTPGTLGFGGLRDDAAVASLLSVFRLP